jgi:hypothetical protein
VNKRRKIFVCRKPKNIGGGPSNPANPVRANKPHIKNNNDLPGDKMPVNDKVYFFSH